MRSAPVWGVAGLGLGMVELVSGDGVEGADELREEHGEHLDGAGALGVLGDGALVVGHGPGVAAAARVEGLGRLVAVGVGGGGGLLLHELTPPVGVQVAESLPLCQTIHPWWGGGQPASTVRAGTCRREPAAAASRCAGWAWPMRGGLSLATAREEGASHERGPCGVPQRHPRALALRRRVLGGDCGGGVRGRFLSRVLGGDCGGGVRGRFLSRGQGDYETHDYDSAEGEDKPEHIKHTRCLDRILSKSIEAPNHQCERGEDPKRALPS
ncbi:hypothetical protein MICRO80W_540001 [Micrococcus luteus]|nr:hypothetical protein MICRO80W_540001 [Micrococcus luteus]